MIWSMLEDYKQVTWFPEMLSKNINISERLVADVEKYRRDQYHGVYTHSIFTISYIPYVDRNPCRFSNCRSGSEKYQHRF